MNFLLLMLEGFFFHHFRLCQRKNLALIFQTLVARISTGLKIYDLIRREALDHS